MNQLEYSSALDEACQLQKKGELKSALAAFKKLLSQHPEDSRVLYYLASSLCTQGSWEQALYYFAAAIAHADDPTPIRYNMALALVHLQRLPEALLQLENLLAKIPDHFDAQHMLAGLYMQQGDFQRAKEHFEYALSLSPDDGDCRYNCAMWALQQGHLDQAQKMLESLRHTAHEDVLYNLGVIAERQDREQQAILDWQAVITQNDRYFDAYYALAIITKKQGDLAAAIAYLERAHYLRQDCVMTAFLLTAWRGDDCKLVPLEYIRQLFDDYAPNYEQQMCEALHFQAPQILYSMLSAAHKSSIKQVLDLGCGTGLFGRQFDFSLTTLCGVDLSAKMLELAESTRKYTNLEQAEIISFLKRDSICYDLMVLCDVLGYIAELGPLFSAISSRLKSGGLLLLSSEVAHLIDKTYELGPDARIKHDPGALLASSASMFNLLKRQEGVLRYQNTQEVQGQFLLFEKSMARKL